jgi:hypothetical protein
MHQGQARQAIGPEESEAQAEAGLTPGITPDLHAPEITHPGDEEEINLHGDVDGSPFSANPGEMSVAEAAEKSKDGADQPSEDMADTRERERESRLTGTPTEALAADDEADTPAPKRSAKK